MCPQGGFEALLVCERSLPIKENIYIPYMVAMFILICGDLEFFIYY
jgi:hypothetical protein